MDDEYPFAPLVAYLRPENLVLAPPEDDSDEVTAIFLLLFGLAFGLLVYWYYFYDPADPAVPEWVRKNVKASKDVELPAWLRDRLPVLTMRKVTKSLGGDSASSGSSVTSAVSSAASTVSSTVSSVTSAVTGSPAAPNPAAPSGTYQNPTQVAPNTVQYTTQTSGPNAAKAEITIQGDRKKADEMCPIM